MYAIKKGRVFTDCNTNVAYITNNKIINGISYQQNKHKIANINYNSTLLKGTNKFKNKYNGTVFSAIQGSSGNNYWHWLFDVLPRLKILNNELNYSNIDYFLFPDVNERFQKETLDLLDIPSSKIISSKVFRHIEANKIIAVDHPYVIRNNPTLEIQNIPKWIFNFFMTYL